MSPRGRALFDSYVANQLKDPAFVGLSMGSHAFNLTSAAGDAHIPSSEIIEEVGTLIQALSLAKGAKP